MSRVKRGVTARARHKKIIGLAKGHKGQRHRVFRRANESVLHALDYAYRHRRERKADFRKLWIARINAAGDEMFVVSKPGQRMLRRLMPYGRK